MLEAAGSRESPGIVRRVLRVRTVVDPVDRLLADSLGWGGSIPNAAVHLLANGTATWTTLATDTLGTAQVDARPGLYRVYGARFLDDEESGKVAGVARALGDGRTVYITGDTTVVLRMVADQPGGLVISEVGDGVALPWETGGNGYLQNVYFEVFNNSSALLYLDGLIFGSATVPYRFTIPTPCPGTELTRNDSTGVHARALLRFPGSGSDYPVAPGQTRLVAWSAIDHRPVHPTLPDLSAADFEIGSGAADNPAVPNLHNIGLELFIPQLLFAAGDVYFLAQPFDLSALEIKFRDSNGRGYYQIPASPLLDVIATEALWPDKNAERPPCAPKIHQVFDRYEGGFQVIGFDAIESDRALRSLQRQVIRVDPSGRKILLNTNTTAVDFAYGPRTPGWIPDPKK